jgi:pyroglutamyl-peptidase
VAKKVLVAGFEAFGGDKVNPSELIAHSLEGRMLSGQVPATRVIPVETRNIRERFEQALLEDDPGAVILVNQMGGRTAMALERVAVNVLDFEFPDNVGVMRKQDVIAKGGSEARVSNVPFDKIVEAWRASGVPGYVSNAAGTFIGNQALYEVLGLTENAALPVVVGLVHVPFLPSQAIIAGPDSTPSMSLELMTRGLEVMIETIVPWLEQRTPDASKARDKGKSLWIPRGVKEIER